MSANNDLAFLLAQRLEQQQAQLDQITRAFTTLLDRQAAAAELSATRPSEAPTSGKSATLAKVIERPPTYDGKDRTGCTTFLNHLRQYFRLNPMLFEADDDKIDFAISYLRGKAFRFVEPHLERRPSDIFGSFKIFADKLVANLGDPDLERTSEKAIRSLTQTGSVSAYSTEFFRLAGFIKWNDDALQSQFRWGLKAEIKRALVYSNVGDADSAKALSDAAIRLDNGLYEIDHDAKRSGGSQSRYPPSSKPAPRQSPTSATPPTHPDPAPMEVDAGLSNKKFGPLTPNQRAHRLANNLCLYCGKAGHRARECRTKTELRATLAGADADAHVASDSEN